MVTLPNGHSSMLIDRKDLSRSLTGQRSTESKNFTCGRNRKQYRKWCTAFSRSRMSTESKRRAVKWW